MEREIVANAFHHTYWGVPIAVYYWLAGISEGMFLIGSLGWGFGIKKFRPISFIISNTAFVLILIVQVFLIFDLGKVDRAIHLFPVITDFWHASSPIAWGVLLVTAYSMGALMYSMSIYMKNEKLARIFGPFAFIMAGGLCWYTGVTLELNPSRHPNHTGMAPLLFFVGATLSGVGAVIIVVWIRDLIMKQVSGIDLERISLMGQILLIGIVFDLFLIFSEFLQMTYGTTEEYHTLETVGTVFWGIVPLLYLGFGLIIPLTIYLTPLGKKRGGFVVASAFVVMGMFGMRLGWVLVGQFTQSFF